MVSVNLAYTAPINSAGASPVLTAPQVWAGLKHKVRHAEEFVPVIIGCRVLSEEGNTVTREAIFAADEDPKGGKGKPVKEVCVHYPPMRVDFQQEDGSNISNIVSKGPEGELLMTYAFEWRGVDEAKEDEMRAKYEKMAKMAVEGSINTIRQMVKDGKIQ